MEEKEINNLPNVNLSEDQKNKTFNGTKFKY